MHGYEGFGGVEVWWVAAVVAEVGEDFAVFGGGADLGVGERCGEVCSGGGFGVNGGFFLVFSFLWIFDGGGVGVGSGITDLVTMLARLAEFDSGMNEDEVEKLFSIS